MLTAGVTKMQVKGTAIIARQLTIVAEFGSEAWRDFFDAYAEVAPELAGGVLPVSAISAETFLDFSDALVRRFYAGDAWIYWRFGTDSASWALTEGPYANFLGTRDLRAFLKVAPALWQAYYSDGHFEAGLEPDAAHVWARIESPVHHVHFEYSVMGFVERALELVGADVRGHEVIHSYSRGDDDVHYRFELAPRD